MKKKNVFLISFLVAGFFLIIGTENVSADKCTQAFQDGEYSCINTKDANQTKNIFDTDTACQTGYCSGGNDIKCCRTACNSDELCTDAVVKDGKLYPPAGSFCVDRGVCGKNRVCCKPEASSGGGTNTSTTGGSTSFTNPLKFTTVEGFLGGIMSAIQKIIVVLALVFIMIGSVMILASAGNSGMVENGKKAITSALVGLAIGIAAPSLLKELAGILGWGQSDAALAKALTLSQIAMNVLNFLLGTMGIIALVMMVIGATLYLTSVGDEDRIDEGKKIFKYSLIGLVMAMSAMILVRQVAQFFI